MNNVDYTFQCFVRKGEWLDVGCTFEGATDSLWKEKIAQGKHQQLVDFSEHISDITQDWRNTHLTF